MNGLKVKDGRLINDRPEPVIGLYEMGRMNKARKRADKVSIIAEGNMRSEFIEEISFGVKKK